MGRRAYTDEERKIVIIRYKRIIAWYTKYPPRDWERNEFKTAKSMLKYHTNQEARKNQINYSVEWNSDNKDKRNTYQQKYRKNLTPQQKVIISVKWKIRYYNKKLEKLLEGEKKVSSKLTSIVVTPPHG